MLAEPTARELLRVLAYPKFRLQAAERERLLEDLHDQVFLDLALAAATPVLVTGDADLLALQETVPTLQILIPADVHSWLCFNT